MGQKQSRKSNSAEAPPPRPEWKAFLEKCKFFEECIGFRGKIVQLIQEFESEVEILVVADRNNGCLRAVILSGGVIGSTITIAGRPGARGHTDGACASAKFSSPCGVSTVPDSGCVVASDGCCIRTVLPTHVSTLAGHSRMRGYQEGIGAKARFTFPADVAVHGDWVYVSDSQTHTLRRVHLQKGQTQLMAGSPTVHGFVNGVGPAVRLHSPTGIIACSGHPNEDTTLLFHTRAALFFKRRVVCLSMLRSLQPPAQEDAWSNVPDQGHSRLRGSVFGPARVGVVTPCGPATAGGVARGLKEFGGLAQRDEKTIVVTDPFAACVKEVTLREEGHPLVRDLVGSADGFFKEEARAPLVNPAGIAFDSHQTLYIADTGAHCIYRVRPHGTLELLVGGVGEAGHIDAVGTEARFNCPVGLTVVKHFSWAWLSKC